MKKIRTPFFEIGTKNYIYGDDVLKLAIAADKMAEKYNIKESDDKRSLSNMASFLLRENVINEDANAKLTTDSFGSGMYTILGLPFCTTGDRSRYTGAAWYAVGHKQCSYWTATPRTQTYDTCANWIKIDASESAPIAMSALAMSSGFVVKSMKEK